MSDAISGFEATRASKKSTPAKEKDAPARSNFCRPALEGNTDLEHRYHRSRCKPSENLGDVHGAAILES